MSRKLVPRGLLFTPARAGRAPMRGLMMRALLLLGMMCLGATARAEEDLLFATVVPGAPPNVDALGSIFQGIRATHFAANRDGYFHYQLQAHRYDGTTFSGVAELTGDDGIVSLACAGIDDHVRNTILHELGHNLGLHHGGSDACNRKPPYNSIMKYGAQFKGIDANCDALPDGIDVIGFSSGQRPTIDEMKIDENTGVCGTAVGAPIDWNNDGVFNLEVALDLNPYVGQSTDCGGTLTALADHDDWSNLKLAAAIALPTGGGEPVAAIVSCSEVPEVP